MYVYPFHIVLIIYLSDLYDQDMTLDMNKVKLICQSGKYMALADCWRTVGPPPAMLGQQ